MMEAKEKQKNAGRGNASLNISECGVYAYLSICSICLSNLFPNDSNLEFNRKYIKSLCKRLNANENQEIVMMALLEDNNGQSTEPYVTLLLKEPVINGKAILIIQFTVFSAVQSGEYDARQRVLIRNLAEILRVPFELIELYEHSLVELLTNEESSQTEEEKEAVKRRGRIKKIKRYVSVGVATMAGGTLIGLTGGLAAPFIGVGIGTILGGASAAALTSTAGMAIIGSIFGFAGAGLTGYKMNKRVGHIEEFSFEPLSRLVDTDRQLHIAIAITGWLKSEETAQVLEPWHCLSISREQYALKYESKYLVELGQAFEYILSMAVSFATQEALKYTILSGLMSAIAWPAALLSMASIIDNPWSVCCRRSSEVGKQLAHVLLTREHGKRPVTLIGYSLGARVIFYCLREMDEIGGKNAQGIIQDAILLGAPVTTNEKQWNKCCRVVAGKIVNGYSKSDWLLRFLYRTLSMTAEVSGLMALENPKIENVDLSLIVKGHTEYSLKLEEILKLVGVKTKTNKILDDEGVIKKSLSENDQTYKLYRNLSDVNLRETKSSECLSQIPSTSCTNNSPS